MAYYVYIVKCADSSYYTGFTTNTKRRIWSHNNSKFGAKSLKGKRPVKLIYSEKFLERTEALRREREIKGWSRKKKMSLIYGNTHLR